MWIYFPLNNKCMSRRAAVGASRFAFGCVTLVKMSWNQALVQSHSHVVCRMRLFFLSLDVRHLEIIIL